MSDYGAYDAADFTARFQSELLNFQGARENQQAIEGMVREQQFRVPILKYGLVENIECNFTFAFLHQPQFSCHFALDNKAFVFKQFLPTVQAAVVDWRVPTGESEDSLNPGVQWAPHYGAKVTATVTGHMYQRGTLHLAFTGRSLVYPIAAKQRDATFTRPVEEEDE